MPKQSKSFRAYRAVLHLYPRTHRQEYGQQMLQTFEDMRDDYSALAVWFRVAKELPLNVVQEHITNLEGVKMSKLATNKRVLLGTGAVLIVGGGLIFGLVLRGNKPFEPTTLAKIQKSGSKPACIQKNDIGDADGSLEEQAFIANAVTTTIIDVPAGTNVESYFKTYSDTKATGSAVYTGNYGTYNFVAEKTVPNVDTYTGKWKITHFEPCQ